MNSNSLKAKGHHSSLEVRAAADTLSSFCLDDQMFQLNMCQDSSGNILNSCLTNVQHLQCKKSIKFIFNCNESHHPLVLNLNINCKLQINNSQQLYNFKRADVNAILKEI